MVKTENFKRELYSSGLFEHCNYQEREQEKTILIVVFSTPLPVDQTTSIWDSIKWVLMLK